MWSPACTGSLKEHPVFLQHGVIDMGGTWFFNPGNKSLGLLLADDCHDVWIGNNRGTVYSYRHADPSIDDNTYDYWDFSFDQMGRYDLPANIDFVKNQTGKDQVIYIGHSQGTTQFWIQACLNETFGQNIKAFAGIAPVMYMGNSSSWLIDAGIKLYLMDFLSNFINTIAYFR